MSGGSSKAEYRMQAITLQRDIALTLSRIALVLERIAERQQYRD